MKPLTKAAAIGATAAAIGLGQATADPTGASKLADTMTDMGVDFALILQGAPVDNHPIWSTDGAWLAVDLAGHWHRFRLDSLELELAGWHLGDIGLLAAEPEHAAATPDQVTAWRQSTPYDPRKLTTSDGLTVTMTAAGAFRIQQQGQGAKTLFQTGGENCHSLSLSPDERLLAFICELNGLFVYRLPG